MYTAIIPVRKGSRRLPGKNTAPFADSNLLIYKIQQLKKVPQITKIVVTSDCHDMLVMGKAQGVDIHKRSIEYCDEKTKSFGEVVAHVAESVEGENIIWATCTSPLVEPKHYEDAIARYEIEIKNGYDSLMSVEEFRRYIWTKTGPLNYELGIKHVPSQELEPLYRVTDGILISPRLKMIEWQYFHGINPYMYVMDKKSSVDIDDVFDLACAKAWLDI
ncbi:cytidylyltransferase domain-containing protein [Methylotuvimicrobium buryatense]|uniref:Acylneuraminate cytidylyltransferase family protein n=1 Tax=Methylotuvimicrobium buryatense TaxID=95641 RepID=A0A4P9URA5_METBY|nr:cytidyltransferase [Methylotuvimicrobium buryatense]QCW84009.1 acylneuraminate cytidylyltransferase family protein [Methylotuvimicrobium buryatense]